MATLKKGNLLAHAKASGKKIVFKKPAVKKTSVPAVKKAAKPRFKYELQCKKTAAGIWQPLMGANGLENLTAIARQYARKFPSHAFRIV